MGAVLFEDQSNAAAARIFFVAPLTQLRKLQNSAQWPPRDLGGALCASQEMQGFSAPFSLLRGPRRHWPDDPLEIGVRAGIATDRHVRRHI